MNEFKKSPFKFLDPFAKEDRDLFFGRDEEIELLYEMTFDTRLIVFFGASGTGKTSMIQCGLANKFSETRWQELYIRRNRNIYETLIEIITEKIRPYDPKVKVDSAIQGLNMLQRYTSKPIFLTFDQFEELFIVQPDAEEQEGFFKFLQELLDTRIACKVIIVMREEFIANLWDFEAIIPTIFNNRFRIKELEKYQMQQIVENTLQALQEQEKLKVEQAEQVATGLLQKLEDGKTGIGLTYLQVLLDRYYRRASLMGGTVPTLDLATLRAMGSIEDVIDDFLDEQLAVLEEQLGPAKRGIPLKILGAMVSDERTKKVLDSEDLESLRTQFQLSEEELNLCLKAFETMRIINRYET